VLGATAAEMRGAGCTPSRSSAPGHATCCGSSPTTHGRRSSPPGPWPPPAIHLLAALPAPHPAGAAIEVADSLDFDPARLLEPSRP
jgi:hypothetical protein